MSCLPSSSGIAKPSGEGTAPLPAQKNAAVFESNKLSKYFKQSVATVV